MPGELIALFLGESLKAVPMTKGSVNDATWQSCYCFIGTCYVRVLVDRPTCREGSGYGFSHICHSKSVLSSILSKKGGPIKEEPETQLASRKIKIAQAICSCTPSMDAMPLLAGDGNLI
ncbi:hypothetical protein NC651_003318 [Populus alba x Populus x berolinensis]|nr:hypothetical protein NC651_003318 [Populus alba x Populus x berolinensis]